jgi:hypothetical protein
VSAWWMNIAALMVASGGIAFLALALLWRVGSWQTHRAQSLIEDEGIRIGAPAPQIAAHKGEADLHLSFEGEFSLVVFGARECQPCQDLLRVATRHPATSYMRLVYIGDDEEVDVEPEVAERWETYRFDDERHAREAWRAFVNPYFHVVDPQGKIMAKGIANRPAHLDRLLGLSPSGARLPILEGTSVLMSEGRKRG